MKLITKFILIYLLVTVIVLGIGGYISYVIIKGEVDKELKWEFLERIDRVTYLMEEGREFDPETTLTGGQNLQIHRLTEPADERVEVSDTLIWHDYMEQYEQNVKVSAYRNINGNSYYITTYGAMIESDDITEAVTKTLLWILVMQVIGAVGIGFYVSGSLFKPFRKTLDKINSFRLQEKKPVLAEETGIHEFNELNHFVESMTVKAISDFNNLKEFSENASHELQTPLAIAKGRLELLSETPLTEEQYGHIQSLEASIKKCSRLSKSLSLLTKIENHEYNSQDTVNLSQMIDEGLQTFSEFVELNNLSISKNIAGDVEVKLHPALAEIILSNLLQNAIKHNVDRGEIYIKLTERKWVVANTGPEPDMDPNGLFERFRKADQNSSSIGLGLSIVKQITDKYLNGVEYTVKNGWHILTIYLKDVKQG